MILMVAATALAGTYDPLDMALMATATVSHEEHMRRNPKWSEAVKGPDQDRWLAAGQKERDQQFNPDHTTLRKVDGGVYGVPSGEKIYPIKRHCKIKHGDEYKVRWVVLGNLYDFEGDTFSPTASNKLLWLLFALMTLLRLHRRFFDISGAFMAERPKRDVYVISDGVVYLLTFNLNGLTDAAKFFNEGLVVHLESGGCIQSTWD